MSRRSSKRNQAPPSDSSSDSDLIGQLADQQFTDLPDKDPKMIPPKFSSSSDESDDLPVNSSDSDPNDPSIANAITTRNLEVDVKSLEKLGAQLDISSSDSDDQVSQKNRRSAAKRSRKQKEEVLDEKQMTQESPKKKVTTFDLPQKNDDAKSRTSRPAAQSYAKRSVIGGTSYRSKMSATSWKTAKTNDDRVNERLEKFNLNPEEVEFDAENAAREMYAKMLREKCPTIVQNKAFLQKKQNRHFNVNTNDEQLKAMTRIELFEENKKIEKQIQDYDAKLNDLYSELTDLRKQRDKLKNNSVKDKKEIRPAKKSSKSKVSKQIDYSDSFSS